MDIHNLDSIFKPRRIALIGVTPNPKSAGGTILRNLVGSGFNGVVYPVNPACEAVLGIQCHSSISHLPHPPDLAVICAPAPQIPEIITDCGKNGVRGIIIISAGFRESGPAGRDLESQVLSAARQFPGMRIIGPNCLGIIIPSLNLNLSFASGMPKPGHVAFISQSGALCTSVLDWAIEENVGFSHFVSIGNMLDVDFGDLIDYFGEDENTKSIILYIESITDARKFMTASRAFARTKPIVAYKAGRFPQSAEAAASHTGAMAGEDDIYEAAFQRAGIIRVLDIGEIFDCADLIGRKKIPRGPRLGIITNAGGPGVMATDALIAENGILAPLTGATLEALNENLPDAWSHRNPVDVLGDAKSNRLAKAAQIVVADPNVDAVLVILTPQAMTNPSAAAKAVAQLADSTPKPILAAWLGGQTMREGIRILNDAGIATYPTPEQAVRAFMTLVAYSRNLEILYQTPRDIQINFPATRTETKPHFQTLLSSQPDDTPRSTSLILPESESKRLLASYGIPVTESFTASDAHQACHIAEEIGYPVVLKVLSPHITHKTDAGGVALNLTDEHTLRTAYDRMMHSVGAACPEAWISGVTVQKMIDHKNGVELILGTKKDPVFGTVIMAGTGGITAELLRDRALGFPPLNERLARRMLESLKIYPLFKGYRGNPPIDIDRVIEVMIRMSYLVTDYPQIKELDVNPLLALPSGAIALDSRIVSDPDLSMKDIQAYQHLALRPYPEEYVTERTLKDGSRILLRPIKPEDEPMWMAMLGSCSRESIYMRFRYFFNWATHDVAVRYCFIDYDREIAIVAEHTQGESRKLLGVGRLVADPDHENVEYAVLIADEWQNKGLGSILTDACFEIAKRWGLKRIVAQTTTDNPRMIEVFQKRDFTITTDASSSMVEVAKDLF